MNNFMLLDWCGCDGSQSCMPCKVLAAVVLAIICGMIGYFIGRKASGK